MEIEVLSSLNRSWELVVGSWAFSSVTLTDESQLLLTTNASTVLL